MSDFKKLFGKYIYVLASVLLLGSGGLFGYLQLQGLQFTPNLEEITCDKGGTIYFNVTNPTSLSKYIYNYDDFPLRVKGDLYVKYYGKWRFTNFTMSTRFGNIPSDRKYVFVFPAKATKEFKLECYHKTSGGFKGLSGYVG